MNILDSGSSQYLQQVVSLGASFGLKLIVALLIFVIGKRIAIWSSRFLSSTLSKNGTDSELSSFLESVTYWGILALVVVAALAQLGVQTASFIAAIGAAGLAVGLALQGSLSNFAAGILILVLRPFKLQDYVDVAGESGSVTRIHIFNTELRTADNKRVIIPNARVLDSNIVNYTSTGRRRVDCEFGVGYGDDLDKVKSILKNLVTQDPRVLDTPEPVIAVHTLADSSVNLVVRPWVKTEDYWPFYWDLTEQVKKQFDANDIEIPFPQQVIHRLK